MDASWLWMNTAFSDVMIRLLSPPVEPEPETSRPVKKVRKNPSRTGPTKASGDGHDEPGCLELPAHAAVLACMSGYWKARLLRWPDSSSTAGSTDTANGASHKAIVLEETVDSADGLETARQVLSYGYTRQFAAGVSIKMLMQMTVIADKWDMPEVVEACLQEAADRTEKAAQSCPLDDVSILLDSKLPDTVRTHRGYRSVRSQCLSRLLGQFGRAQRVMTNASLLQSFCSLSLEAVALWAEQEYLATHSLQVDSENTVAVLFTHWWDKNSSGFVGPQKTAAASVLTKSVRACHLSASFVRCVLDELPWFQPSKEALQVLRTVHSANTNTLSITVTKMMPPAWSGRPHGFDRNEVNTLSWEVSREELEQLHKDAAEGPARLLSEPLYYCGYWWRLILGLTSQNSELIFGIRYSVALPASYTDANPSVLPASWIQTVETSDEVYEDECDFDDGHPLEFGVVYGGDSRLLQVPASSAPRAHSYPPDNLWHEDGKLHLGLEMRNVS